jgi:hypothetical protein
MIETHTSPHQHMTYDFQHPLATPLPGSILAEIFDWLSVADLVKIRLLNTWAWDWVSESVEMKNRWEKEYNRVVGIKCPHRSPCLGLFRYIGKQLFDTKLPSDEAIAKQRERINKLELMLTKNRTICRQYQRRKQAEPFQGQFQKRLRSVSIRYKIMGMLKTQPLTDDVGVSEERIRKIAKQIVEVFM